MPPRYSVLTSMWETERLALLVIAPLMALAAYGILHLASHSWPAACLAVVPAGPVLVFTFHWLVPRLAAFQVEFDLSHSGFTSVTRVSGLADYPIGKVVFTAIDTVDDDQPVTIEASWCHRHLLITVYERKGDQ
jgi:hypothetical protein